MRTWLCCKVLLFSVFLIVNSRTTATAGELRGKVVITRPKKMDSQIMSRELIRRYVDKNIAYNQHAEDEDYPTIVLYLESSVKFPKPAQTGNSKMLLNQVEQVFVPHVLPVMVGTTVDFLNSDDVYHNVFSFSPPKNFDLGRYRKGKSRSVTFDKSGVVKVYCDIHTHMNAFILVLENPYFTTTDEKGNFEIENIPAGKYTVKAWPGRWPEKSVEIEIKDSEVTTINFKFP